MDLEKLATFLGQYAFCSECFKPYLEWLVKQPNADLENNVFMSILSKRNNEELERLEKGLSLSREILGLSRVEFLKVFGFSSNLLTIDSETVNDILAEPYFVITLSNNGFKKIRKLPNFIKHQGDQLAVADFVAFHSGKKYAIELKTVHEESETLLEFVKRTGYPPMPNHWDVMLWNNFINKIEDKDKKAITQLKNTKHHYSCHYTMFNLPPF